MHQHPLLVPGNERGACPVQRAKSLMLPDVAIQGSEELWDLCTVGEVPTTWYAQATHSAGKHACATVATFLNVFDTFQKTFAAVKKTVQQPDPQHFDQDDTDGQCCPCGTVLLVKQHAHTNQVAQVAVQNHAREKLCSQMGCKVCFDITSCFLCIAPAIASQRTACYSVLQLDTCSMSLLHITGKPRLGFGPRL